MGLGKLSASVLFFAVAAAEAQAPEMAPAMGHGLDPLEFPSWAAPETRRRIGPALRKVTAADLPARIPDGSLDDLKTSLSRQIRRCAGQPPTLMWTFGARRVSRRTWCTETNQKMLTIAQQSQTLEEVYARAKVEFEWYQSIGRNGAGEVLFTGYYYPTLRGSRTKDATYQFPLYKRPSDLVQISVNGNMVWRRKLPDGTYVPYYTRSEIDQNGALAGKGFELVYVDNAFDAFILQIQGSGQVMVAEEDGSTSRMIVNYAAQNGHPYVSIGSVLRSRGVDPSYLTLQGLRRYFVENPDQLWPVMMENRSYVFFGEGQDGPFGSAGTVLVPGHSIAVDTGIFPMGALALYETSRPMSYQGDQGTDWQQYSRLAVAQDTGGAIRGAGRVDTYWGGGPYAEIVAGQMAHTGVLYFALPPARH